MKTFAVIVGNSVVNIAVAGEALADDWIDITDRDPMPGIGWGFLSGNFIAPDIPAPVPPIVTPRYLSKLGFRNRFTPMEKARMEMAAIDNPAASMNDRMFSALMRATLADQRDATYIDPMRLDTREGVINMETAGLLDAPGRALQILDAPILDDEMFKG